MTSLLLMALLIMKGVLGQTVYVRYNEYYPTVQEASYIAIHCLYQYPKSFQIRKTIWYKDNNIIVYHTDEEMIHPSYKGRTWYFGDKNSICTLLITNLQVEDSGTYIFRFEMDEAYYAGPVLQLKVTEIPCQLSIQSPDVFEEGKEVTVTCSFWKSSIYYPYWFNGSVIIPEQIHVSDRISTLRLIPSRQDHSNVLLCRKSLCPDKELKLNVWYKPGEPQITMDPVGMFQVQERAAVNLTCKAQCNPAADSYLWYRDGAVIENAGRQTLHILRASPANAGNYSCKAKNVIGDSSLSPPLTLNVLCSSCTSAFLVLPTVLGALAVLLVLLTMGIGTFFYTRKKKRQEAVRPASINTSIYDNVATLLLSQLEESHSFRLFPAESPSSRSWRPEFLLKVVSAFLVNEEVRLTVFQSTESKKKDQILKKCRCEESASMIS
uniref:B-cell receptor CD22 n=1 Tax=Geotrypetes seraphini TaxID=260995 RepID=A0A6P8SQJ9_GEOSA|nr:sialoadhesin-like [Geotrypetes seraphini]